MRLDALAGNDALKEQLAAHSRGRGLAHAYILAGPRGIGKHTLARALAAALVAAAPAGEADDRTAVAVCLRPLSSRTT